MGLILFIIKTFSLSKAERLRSRKLIGELFSKGKNFSIHPLRVAYLPSAQLQAGFGVSTRNFKKATDRNRIKRLLREAYRLQKNLLHQKPVALFILYTGKELPDYGTISQKMKIALEKLNELLP